MSQQPLIDCDPNFVHIFRYMFREGEIAKLGPYCFTVYVCIKTYSNIKTGSAWPGIPKIVAETGISRRKVIDSIAKLCESGYIRKTETDGKVNQYKIVEKIPYSMPNEVEKSGDITFDYTASILKSAVSEIKHFAMTGDASNAKVIQIEHLTINVIQQQDNGVVNVNVGNTAEHVTDTRTLEEKMQSLPEDNPVRRAWESSRKTRA